MPSPAMSRLRPSGSSQDTKRRPLSSSGSSAGMSIEQGFVASRVRALQQQQEGESGCKTRPQSERRLACSLTRSKRGPFNASLEDLPGDPRSSIAITNMDNRSNRPSEISGCNQRGACRVTSIPEEPASRTTSSADVDTRGDHSNHEHRHTHIRTKTLSCVKESMFPPSVPKLDNFHGTGQSSPANPVQHQPAPCPGKELSNQDQLGARNDRGGKRCSSNMILSSKACDTGILDKSNGEGAKAFECPYSMGDAEHQTSDSTSTGTGSYNCSDRVVLDQPGPHSRDGFDLRTQNRDCNIKPTKACSSSSPSTPDASIGDSRKPVVTEDNQISMNPELWATEAGDHLSKDPLATKSCSRLETHSSTENLVSNNLKTPERRQSSLTTGNVSEASSMDQIEPKLDKQFEKDLSRRNGSVLGDLLTGKWLRTVVESKTPQVDRQASRRRGPTSPSTYGLGKEIDGDETTDYNSNRSQKAEAGDAASTSSSRQRIIDKNAKHDASAIPDRSTIPRTATPPASPGPPAEQPETFMEVVSSKPTKNGATQEGRSPFQPIMSVPAESSRGSPFEYPACPSKSHAVNSATAERPAAVQLGNLRLTITLKDGTVDGTNIRKVKVKILLETEEDLMVEAHVKRVEQEGWRDNASSQG